MEKTITDLPEPRKDKLQNVNNLPDGAISPAEYELLDEIQQHKYILEQAKAVDDMDAAKEKMLAHIEDLSEQDVKNRKWEANHRRITWSMSVFVHNRGRMPTHNEIARDTNLSRQTVLKHLQTYQNHPLFNEQFGYFQFMVHRVMGVLLQKSLEGDTRAIKMYLDMLAKPPGAGMQSNTFINNNQHNYMQINNTVLNQQVIQGLSPEQLGKIEEIINGGKGKED